MTQPVRDIRQHFLRHGALPHLELRSTFESTQAYRAHSHTELSIGAILSGSTCLTLNGEKHLLKSGELVVIGPELVHACNPLPEKPRSYHMLYVEHEWCLGRLSALYGNELADFSCGVRVLRSSELFQDYLKLAASLEKGECNAASLAFEKLIFPVLTQICSPSPPKTQTDELPDLIRERLLENLAGATDLQTLAMEFDRSRESLIRVFRRRFGITPAAFVHNARIEKARLLLRDRWSIADTACEVGFSDQSRFHKAFVNYTACTPRQYQQNLSTIDNIS